MVEPIHFGQYADGRVVLEGAWPEEIGVSYGFLEHADPSHVTSDAEHLWFVLDNAHARYRFVGDDPAIQIKYAQLVSGKVRIEEGWDDHH